MIMFSIAIPVYNVEEYLGSCLDSVCRQLADDIEVLLMDDGSTDLSGAICDEYAKKDSRIHVFHQSNQGVSAARNTLIQKARGKWIVFVDGDDVLADNALQIMRNFSDGTDELVVFEVRRFSNDFHPGASVSCTDEKCVTGAEIMDFRLGILDEKYKKQLFSEFNLRSPWAKMWNLCYIRNVGIQFQAGLKYGEDMLFNFAAARNMKKIRLVPQCVYGYRSNNTSITLRFSEDAVAFCSMAMKSLISDMNSHMELHSVVMQDALWKKAASYFQSALTLSVQHPDCSWNHARRMEEIKELCDQDWVKKAGEYAAKTGTLTPSLHLALRQEYDKLERYCRRKRIRYSVVQWLNKSTCGQKFVRWYSERKK